MLLNNFCCKSLTLTSLLDRRGCGSCISCQLRHPKKPGKRGVTWFLAGCISLCEIGNQYNRFTPARSGHGLHDNSRGRQYIERDWCPQLYIADNWPDRILWAIGRVGRPTPCSRAVSSLLWYDRLQARPTPRQEAS